MKPIAPGCKARLINCRNPRNEGKIVTVIRYIGHVPGWRGDDRWEIDIVLYEGTTNEMRYHADESKLQRIDDEYDGNETGSWEALKDIWQPLKGAVKV